jgi:hypothetical protein
LDDFGVDYVSHAEITSISTSLTDSHLL